MKIRYRAGRTYVKGEINEMKDNHRIYKIPDNYIKVFGNPLYYLITDGAERDLLMFMILKMDYETNCLNYNTAFFTDMGNTMKSVGRKMYSPAYITKCLVSLRKKKLVKRLKKGYYFINPLYFWRGDKKRRPDICVLWLEEQWNLTGKGDVLIEGAFPKKRERPPKLN